MEDALRARNADGPRLEFRLLGPLEVRLADRTLTLGGAKPRALLVDLLLHLGRVVPVDRLIDDLWGEDAPETAAHAVEVYVSQLRKALDPDRAARASSRALVTAQPGYLLDVEPEQVDLHRFRRLADEGRGALAEADPARASLALAEALALWRGPAIADFAYEPFAQGDIAELEELRLAAVEDRIEAELAVGRHAPLVAELEALIAVEPLRERPRRQLMLALYRSGRQADALAAYQATRRMLRDELGIEPGPDLRALEAAILRQDDALRAPVAPGVTGADAAGRQKRKLATILFAAVADATALADRLDAETLHGVMGRYFNAVSVAVARHGGTVESVAGDVVMAAFGIPAAHEDDALRATRAAVDVHGALAALSDRLSDELDVRLAARVGIENGEVFAAGVAAEQAFVAGQPVTVAAGLQRSAAPGETVIGESAQRLIAHGARLDSRGRLELEGGSGPLETFRLLELSPAAPAVARRLDAPLVGRERELAVLRRVLEKGIRTATAQVVCVLGPAGIGKSRLAEELVRVAGDDITALSARCRSYGDGITYWPLRTVVRQAVGDVSRETIEAALAGDAAAGESASRVAAANLAAAVGSGDEVPSAAAIAWAFRRFCETVGRRRLLLLVFDDLHWAQPTFLELLEHVADRSSGSPIVMICLAREELLEEHPDFLRGRANVETLVPEILARADMEMLLDGLLAGRTLSPEARGRLVEAAGGNPLFLEQLFAFLGEDWSVGVDRPLPPTIQALLAGRLDRLGPGERGVLERAAVVGTEFRVGALAPLLAPEGAVTLRRHLGALATRGFIESVPSASAAETFRFRHGLIHEAVYRAAPKAERARLHERLADWLERTAGGRVQELEEVLGYHLEQAYRLRADLGPPDRRAKQLAAGAADRLGAAGLRAWKRGDAPAADNLLGRATDLLRADDARRLELMCELAGAVRVTHDAERGVELLEQALERSRASGARRIELRARIELAGLRLFADPEGRSNELLAVAGDAVPALEKLGDDRSLGRAWLLSAFVHGGVHCRHGAAEQAAGRALVHYERSGWPVSTCLGQLAAALYYGPSTVAEAIDRCEELLAATAADPLGEANVLVFRGGLEAQAENFEAARDLLARARSTYEGLGLLVADATMRGAVAGDVELLAGDAQAAVDVLGATCETLARARDVSVLSSREADLAEALYVQGCYPEAEHWIELAERHTASDDLAARIATQAVRAKLLARNGAWEQAEALGRKTLRLAKQTEAVNQHAKVLLDLAEVRRLDGRLDAARACTEPAIRLYESKGNLAGARRARSLLLAPAAAYTQR